MKPVIAQAKAINWVETAVERDERHARMRTWKKEINARIEAINAQPPEIMFRW